MKDISVLIFEDNLDLRDSLRLLINGTVGYTVVSTYPNCSQVRQAIKEYKPDTVLMDIDMPEVNGIEGLKVIKEIRPETHVIMLTVFDQDNYVFEAICAGANGYLLKKSPPAEIIKAISEVSVGGAPMTPAIAKKVLSFFSQQKASRPKENLLTPKEKEVLKLLVEGFSYKMITEEQEVSIDTVRTHIKNIYRKLHVHSMSEAVAKAIREDLV